MRIAMVAPVFEPVPPLRYGGTERVISALTEGLVQRGHDVTLFASAESRTGAKLVPSAPRALHHIEDISDPFAYNIAQLKLVYQHPDEFDIIHDHTSYAVLPFAHLTRASTVHTTHGRLDLAEYRQVYRSFPQQKLVSVSNAQRLQVPELNWVATVHNGIDARRFQFKPLPGNYLVFLGQIRREKRPDHAVQIACAVGMRLIIAGNIHPKDKVYYETEVAPLIRDCPLVEYVGEVDDIEKDRLLGGAYACLFPIDWPEPFGLTMLEAMATGTPVVARNLGAVAEVIDDGITGFMCANLDDMVEAVTRVGQLKRWDCRERVERLFSADRMVTSYLGVYERILE